MPDLADKFKVREYIKAKGYGHTLNNLYGVYDKFDDIDFNNLPDRFVLKANHGCGFNMIVKDKKTFNIHKARKQFNRWMRMNFFYYTREWVYKKIDRKIICEKYLENIEYDDLIDYKITCIYGKVKCIDAMYGRNNGGYLYEPFDRDWVPQKPNCGPHNKFVGEIEVPKSSCHDEMIKMAEAVSKDFPHLRVDVYIINNQLIFGELTFFPGGGIAFEE